MTALDMYDYKIVVMDGSNLEVVRHIAYIIAECISTVEGSSIDIHQADENHPTMIVIDFRTIPVFYDVSRIIIDYKYPGLCAFNPKF